MDDWFSPVLALDTYGRVVEWYWLPLDQPDHDFNPLIASFEEQTIALLDFGFRDKRGLPSNIKICPKGTGNERMIVETAFSMLTMVCPSRKRFHRVANYIWSHCAYLAPCLMSCMPCFIRFTLTKAC